MALELPLPQPEVAGCTKEVSVLNLGCKRDYCYCLASNLCYHLLARDVGATLVQSSSPLVWDMHVQTRVMAHGLSVGFRATIKGEISCCTSDCTAARTQLLLLELCVAFATPTLCAVGFGQLCTSPGLLLLLKDSLPSPCSFLVVFYVHTPVIASASVAA